jgi:hypothetical protein
MSENIVIRKESARAESSSGGKDYHLVLIRNNENDRALYVERYGRAGQWGAGFKVHRGSIAECEEAYRRKYQEKMGPRGQYKEKLVSVSVQTDLENAKLKIGVQLWPKIGQDHLEWCMPGLDASGSKQQEDVEWEEGPDGKPRRKEKKPLLIPDDPDQKMKEGIAMNKDWGAF